MRILISNDDGVRAPGIQVLAERMALLGEVTVVAPDRNRSGASNSLTLDRPLRVHKESERVYAIDGTPTDCVHLAITGLLAERPDIVVSGINCGANLGDDVLYSGTVAAAMEGRFMGFPAIAVSCVDPAPRNYPAAAEVVARLTASLQERPLPAGTILNVNVPDRPFADLSGYAVTRLGNRHIAERVIEGRDPHGHTIYWIGPAGPEQDAGVGTDFHAVAQGKVSITPLHTDLSNHAAIASVGDWIAEL